jgi:hypothetical protein
MSYDYLSEDPKNRQILTTRLVTYIHKIMKEHYNDVYGERAILDGSNTCGEVGMETVPKALFPASQTCGERSILDGSNTYDEIEFHGVEETVHEWIRFACPISVYNVNSDDVKFDKVVRFILNRVYPNFLNYLDERERATDSSSNTF